MSRLPLSLAASDPDGKLRIEPRLAVRRALAGPKAPLDQLRRLAAVDPAGLEGALEEERLRNPEGIEALRRRLGTEPDPWAELAVEAVVLFESAGSDTERVLVAGRLLAGEGRRLPAVVTALARTPGGLPLLATMHAIGRREQRGRLARYLAESDVQGPVVARDGARFLAARQDGDVLAVAWEDGGEHHTVVGLTLGVGVADLVVHPVEGRDVALALLGEGTALDLGEVRERVAFALARQGARSTSPTWAALGHLVHERLFPSGSSGFTVGQGEAAELLDRLGRVVQERRPELALALTAPGSPAEVALELFGAPLFEHVLGLHHHVERLEVSVDAEGLLPVAEVVGWDLLDQARTRTRLTLARARGEWHVSDIEVLGLGQDDLVLASLHRVIAGPGHLDIISFEELRPEEQALVAGLLDDGFRADEVGRAVHALRGETGPGTAEARAAAAHVCWLWRCGEDPDITAVADRHGASLEELEGLL